MAISPKHKKVVYLVQEEENRNVYSVCDNKVTALKHKESANSKAFNSKYKIVERVLYDD